MVNITTRSIYELHLAALARRLVEMEEERDISSSTWPPRWKKQQVTQQRIYGRRLLDALRATPEHHARARRRAGGRAAVVAGGGGGGRGEVRRGHVGGWD